MVTTEPETCNNHECPTTTSTTTTAPPTTTDPLSCNGDNDHKNSLKEGASISDSFLLEDSTSLRKIGKLGPEMRFAFNLRVSQNLLQRKEFKTYNVGIFSI